MSVKWTEAQQQVIDLRNRNILVSAAAGSGKTAVLVERIITRLTRDEHPLNVDELLIVTFTEAAAAEMKERILGAIEAALEKEPENEHLQRQATLIHNALITTIHSFCLSVIRDHFHEIDLDPGFRIAEEGELKLLKHDVLQELLEMKYQQASDSFFGFVERFAAGKTDQNLEDMILKLHQYGRSYPDPEEWLDRCIMQYQMEEDRAVDEVPLMQSIFSYAKDNWVEARNLIESAIEVCGMEDGPAVYEKTLTEDLVQIEQLLEAEDITSMCSVIANIKWARLASNRDDSVDLTKADAVKEARAAVKALVADLQKKFLFAAPDVMLKDIAYCAPVVEELMNLVKDFGQAFQEKKAKKSIIDFSDMEQFALQILSVKEENGRVPSAIAKEYQKRFAEVMIDEYQDSNLIQETILTSVSRVNQGIYNIFMVGDVKQSIYSFRLSRPELFMEKFKTYDPLEESVDTTRQRIDLFQNFRSRKEVLDGCNFVFYQLMRGDMGGIQYDDKAALYPGADYEERSGNGMELMLVQTDQLFDQTEQLSGQSERNMEARAVARRIRELVGHHPVKDKDGTYRPARYRDIVILTRSLTGWSDLYAEVLGEAGVPAYTGSKEGYFETREIGLLLDFMRVLDNPNQDIPLAAVLKSYFGGLTSEELAIVKNTYPDRPFYEAVYQYGREESEGNVMLSARVREFLQMIEHFRERVPHKAIHELLWMILSESGYLDYVTALPAGQQRRANVEMLLEKAVSFESTSYKGLFNFIRYIEQLQKYEMDFGEANVSDEKADTVRIMSIHKSKGLEFPIVFLAGMSKQFNLMDQRSAVVLHPELGVGVDVIDLEKRTRIPTVYKKHIQHQMEVETKGEEMRILYVAMTRAKEKLIMVGTVKKFEDKVRKLRSIKNQNERQLFFSSLFSGKSYMDWMLMALCRHRCFDSIWEQAGEETAAGNPQHKNEAYIEIRQVGIKELVVMEVQEETSDMWTQSQLHHLDITKTYHETFRKNLQEQFEYQYPYANEEKYKMKFTVSELKKRTFLEEEAGEALVVEERNEPIVPKFLAEPEEVGAGSFRGTAYHRFMELLDFTQAYNEHQIENYIDECVKQGLMTKEMACCINGVDVIRFLDTDIAKRMKKAAISGRLFVEQPFVLGVPSKRIYGEESEETVLVQGIIDVYFQEEDGIVVLDYKTDQVSTTEELRERYHAQLEYYGDALTQLIGEPVKERIIYSFTLRDILEV